MDKILKKLKNCKDCIIIPIKNLGKTQKELSIRRLKNLRKGVIYDNDRKSF